MRSQLFFFCILFLTGCSGNEVVLRRVAVDILGWVDTVEAEEYKLKIEDEAENGYRGISFREGSRKDTAIIAEFIPAKKQFIIKRFPVKDTVYITDTLRLKPTDILLRGKGYKERLIWIMSFLITSIIIIVYKGYLNVRKYKKQA
jgi:hypothetical protein